MTRIKYIALSVGVVIAGTSGALFMDGATQIRLPGAANLAALLSDRSPGARKEGALSNKGRTVKVALAPATKPRSKVLPAALPPALAAPVAAVAPAVVPGALPLPVAALPITTAAVPAGSSFFLPPIPLIGGGGGGTTTVINPPGGSNPPPGGGNPPPPGPAVPEPGTWLMLISGFGLLGVALRRRRVRHSPELARGHGRSVVA